MKRLIVLIALLQLGIIAGAKENSTKEGIDVLAVKEGIIDPHVIYDNVSKRPVYLYTLTAMYGHYSWIDNANDGDNTPVN
jgi:hypothetical protein